uniref:Kinesin motor domain-containing protein n=1 Tax=Ditylenchus dipsaci TaxID=166011 RepID=A0A915ECR5_9BILA
MGIDRQAVERHSLWAHHSNLHYPALFSHRQQDRYHPRAARHIFSGIEQRKIWKPRKGDWSSQSLKFLCSSSSSITKKSSIFLTEERHANIGIREDPIKGEIYLKGVASMPINSAEDFAGSAFKNGAMNRTTASTTMNQSSSRLTTEENMAWMESCASHRTGGADCQISTLLILLAQKDSRGLEATGDRQKEGISINCGLVG